MLTGLVPRVSVPCIVHHANEVTPSTDWALPGDQIVASHGSTWSRSRGYWHRAGQLHPMSGTLPAPAASRTSPIKHCQVAHTLKTHSSMSLVAISNVHIFHLPKIFCCQDILLFRYWHLTSFIGICMLHLPIICELFFGDISVRFNQ